MIQKALHFVRGNLWLFIIGALVFIGALYFGKQKTPQSEGVNEVTYEFSDARIGDIDVIVSGVGQLQASQQVDLQSVAAGEAADITGVYVTNNQKVTKGQLLVSLDARTASRRVYDAQLALSSAQIRQSQVHDEFDSETVDDKRQRQLQDIVVAERMSSLLQAQESLAEYEIHAPFTGIITDLQVSEGDSVTRTDKIASVITDENIVAVTLNEVDALSVVEGSPVKMTFDAMQGIELSGQVSRVDTIGIAEQGVVGYGVEITIDGGQEALRPGMSANAEITAQSTEGVLIVPNSAIKSSGQETYIEQRDGGQITQKTVTVGTSNAFHTEITSGLRTGDTVITNTIQPQAVGEENARDTGGLFGNIVPGGGGGRGR